MSGSSPDINANSSWHNVEYLRSGKPEEVAVELPMNADPTHHEEARNFVQSLEDNQQIQHEPGPLTDGKTHQVETDREGNKRLVRKRFSAV